MLFVVLCGVWFRVLSRCLFNSYWMIDINQLQIQSMIWVSTLQIRKYGYFGGLYLIILFVGILPLYAINLGVVSLFTNSSFTFLAMFVITSWALCMSALTSWAVLFRRFKLPFCWFFCSLFFFQNLIMISDFCLWSCTLEQILAYPIDNFLIPCYHQNSQEIVLNTFYSNNIDYINWVRRNSKLTTTCWNF